MAPVRGTLQTLFFCFVSSGMVYLAEFLAGGRQRRARSREAICVWGEVELACVYGSSFWQRWFSRAG
jgi:hypothetical protein